MFPFTQMVKIMKRRLIVMRHAKSSWSSDALTDHDRPLNKRGRRDAPRVAARIEELGWTPQHILSSDSQRTRETCELLRQAWEEDVETDFLRSLYHAGVDGLRQELPRVSDEVETLMLVGHNPGWEDVVCRLTGETVVMKTATAALLEAEFDEWSCALGNRWKIASVLQPREL